MPPPTDIPATLWEQWFAAAGRADIREALQAVYLEIDHAVAALSPRCWLSGRCCNFDQYGHDLFVTGLEIAWALQQLDGEARDRLAGASLPSDGACPFQLEQVCTVHAIRPLGCRLFFCDPAAQSWQPRLHEQFLRQLRRLHEQHGLDYRYLEWRRGLASARAAGIATRP